MTEELILSGAAEQYRLGERVTLLGIEHELRAYTNTELALYDSLCERYDIEGLMAEQSARVAVAEEQSEAAKDALKRFTAAQEERLRLELKEKPLKADEAKIKKLSAQIDELALEYEAAATKNVRLRAALPRLRELKPQAEAATEELVNGQPTPERERELSAIIDEHDRLQRLVDTERVKKARDNLQIMGKVIGAEENLYTEFVWRLWQEKGYKDDLQTFRSTVLPDGEAYTTVQVIVGAMGFPDPLSGVAHVGRRVGRTSGIGGGTKPRQRVSVN